jgi:FG-GAP-like repeat/Cep192 domain 4
LIAADSNDGSVSVLLGNGNGTFQPPASYDVGSAPNWVAVGDFNRDGKLDLAVVNQNSFNVSVLLGKGDGTFQAAVEYAVGMFPLSVTVGDFNGDGNLDLAVTNDGSNNVSVLLGKGDGTFHSAVNYSTGVNPVGVAVGDFNRDGRLDLTVADAGNEVSVLLGKGDGTFETAVNYGAGSQPQSLAVADFNRDGKLDLAVANVDSNNVSVLLGRGDGTFQSPVDYAAGMFPLTVSVADFNSDGKPDLAVANSTSNTISVLLGNGDGTFQAAVHYAAGTGPLSLTAGDFNGNGRLDLAVADISTNTVSVLLQSTVRLSKTALKFADQVVGTNSAAQTVTLTNIGGPLGISSIAVTGTNPTDFSQSNNCGTSVPVAGSCTISIGFKPTKIGQRAASLRITDNAPGSPQSIALSGTGVVVGPNATLSLTSLTFATQLVGSTSPGKLVRLSNYGTMTLSISSITASGDFIQNHTCGSSLAAGASCTQIGIRTGKLSITDNAPGSPQAVSLSGTGTVVELNPNHLAFACTVNFPSRFCSCSPPETTTLTNVGKTGLSITDVTVTGPFSQMNTCPGSLGAGQSCTITVNWARITGSGAVSVSDNGGGSPQMVSLTGNKLCTP